MRLKFSRPFRGKAIAIRLAQDGFDVCINDLATKQDEINSVTLPPPLNLSPTPFKLTLPLHQTVSEIKALGRNSYGHIANVTSLTEVESLIEASVTNLGPLNVMIANAGITQGKPVLEVSEEDVKRMFEVNVYGVFNCYSVAAKQMIKQGGGGKIVGAARLVIIVSLSLFYHPGHYMRVEYFG